MTRTPNLFNLLDPSQYRVLKHFHTYPSPDGETLFSTTKQGDGGAEYCTCADRFQVGAVINDLHAAAYLMARRAGRGLDTEIAERHILHPNVQKSSFTYEESSRRLRTTLAFDHNLPIPLWFTINEFIYIRDLGNHLIGLD